MEIIAAYKQCLIIILTIFDNFSQKGRLILNKKNHFKHNMP